MSTKKTENRLKRLGVFGGTFNPTHVAHLSVAEQVAEMYRLDKVLFIPTAIPPHKNLPDIAPAEDRYRMVELAVESNPLFEVSRIEIDRGGRSFTKDTLRALLRLHTNTELFCIIGSDAVAELATWREPDLVVRLAKMVVVMRPGYDLSKLEDRFRKHIEVAPIKEMDISSTEICNRVRKGLSIEDLVPKKVERYIREKGLYRS